MHDDVRPDGARFSRRDCLRLAALAGLGFALPSWLPAPEPSPAPAPRAKRLIWLYMAGGMSHIDTFDPKPGRPEAGPLGAIPTAVDGVRIGESLPLIAKRMDRAALVRSLTSNQGAHEQGEYLMRTGYQARGTIQHPSLPSWISLAGGRIGTLPAAVAINPGSRHPGAGFLPGTHAPVPIGDPGKGLAASRRPGTVSAERWQRRLDLLAAQDRAFLAARPDRAVQAYADVHREAVALMESPDLAAFDLAQEPEAVRDRYGDHAFAQGCCLARRLVEHGVRAVEVTLGGWDTHDDHFDRFATQARILDGAVAALLDDLQARGLLADTLVVVATEFGRTPVINGNDGRDHHPKAFSALLAGAGIRGGAVHGATDERGSAVASDPVRPADLMATIATALGVDPGRLEHTPDGRPITMTDKGRPLTGILAG
ncbi:MAG: hypothetical protein RLZZ127_1167 [Planctomycetota bacterium]|jgi:uncharacterized protein (DUF1501 family)